MFRAVLLWLRLVMASLAASPVVLITGCSSGIGRALCWAFYRQGCQVVATARSVEQLDDLKAAGMLTLALDVTDAGAIAHALSTAFAEKGQIDIVVNNAGFGQFGPLLDVDQHRLQQQFETNVFAPMMVAQQAAPIMRGQGGGTIVNIGSVSGIVTTPFAGAYCASKAALHSLSEALRMELSPFGIRVVTVQPGAIVSNIGEAVQKALDGVVSAESWYVPLEQNIQERATLSQVGATPTAVFATQLVRQLLQPEPPAVITLGNKSVWLVLLKRVLPRSLMDFLLMRRFGLLSLK